MPRSVDLSSRLVADALCETEAERAALDELRRATGDEDGPMERHSLRCYCLADRMAYARRRDVDRELMLVAALLHDIGLYDSASSGGVYVTDGKLFARSLLEPLAGWDATRIELCLDAIERHHELRPQWDAGAEVELLRRADMFELSSGVLSSGLSSGFRRRLFRAVPRDGVYDEVGRMVLKAFRERPLTMPRIFLRGTG